MVRTVNARGIDLGQLESDLRSQADVAGGKLSPKAADASKPQFLDLLKNGIAEVNTTMKASDQASMDLVSGKNDNIHETMLAVSKAEIGFNLLVQLRNKAIESYQEVMRMQV